MRHLYALAALAALAAPCSVHAQTFAFQTLDNPTDTTFNQLLGINDNGVIVGYYGSGAVGHPNIGYEIAPPYTTYASVMQPGSIQTQATGINNTLLVSGFWSSTNTGNPAMDTNFGFVRQPTGSNTTFVSTTDPLVGLAPTQAQTLGINNDATAAGFYLDANGTSHGYTYALTTATYTTINIKGAASTAATGINDSGETCGFFTNGKGAAIGFVRNASGSVVTKFTVPKSSNTQLLGLNNEGVAVGFYTDKKMVPHGLYYTPSNGAWLTVDDPNGAMGTVVNGINNKNQLVGFYTDSTGNTHGMIVTVTP